MGGGGEGRTSRDSRAGQAKESLVSPYCLQVFVVRAFTGVARVRP